MRDWLIKHPLGRKPGGGYYGSGNPPPSTIPVTPPLPPGSTVPTAQPPGMPAMTPGFTAPSGFNVVSVGPGGIPTLRAAPTTPATGGGSNTQKIAKALVGRL